MKYNKQALHASIDQIRTPGGISSGIREQVCFLEQENDRLRQALIPFAAAAGRPGRMEDFDTGEQLTDDVVLSLGVKVSAWRKANELTSGE